MFRRLLFLAAIASAFAPALSGQQEPPKSPYKKVSMFLLQGDQQIELPREMARVSREQDNVGGVNLPSQYVAHLSNGKAKTRIKEGASVQVLVQLPAQFTPKMVELFRFTNFGGERVVVMQEVSDPTERHINTLSFRANLRSDGQWVFAPVDLKPGEYCFSPRLGNDNFCFGVDKK